MPTLIKIFLSSGPVEDVPGFLEVVSYFVLGC